MRKIIVTITAIFLSSNLIIAQNNTVSVSYGAISTDQTIFTFSAIFASIASEIFGEGSYDSSSFVGPLAVSYHRTLESNERFSYGGAFVYDGAKFKNTDNNSSFGLNAFTLAPEGKFKYLNPQNKFNLYGLLGLGLTVISHNNNESNTSKAVPHFNLQFTPLGLEYGGNVKGFLELGAGYKGIISGGISVSL